MKPAPFKYFAPETVEEVLSLLVQYGFDAKILAGGQSLIPVMNFRLAQPAVLIDLQRIEELKSLEKTDNVLSFGAMVTQSRAEQSDLVQGHAPLLAEALPFIAHSQIRNRGTVGGSLAHADPAAELPAVSLALDARFRIEGSHGSRWVDATDFYIALFTTALGPDEILAEIQVAIPSAPSGTAFVEVARRHGDYALAGVAVRLELDQNGLISNPRIAFLNSGDGPLRGNSAESRLAGSPASVETLSEAARVASEHDVDPQPDMHASVRYRRHLVRVLTMRALETAASRARRAFS